jgi:hypothetical protein
MMEMCRGFLHRASERSSRRRGSITATTFAGLVFYLSLLHLDSFSEEKPHIVVVAKTLGFQKEGLGHCMTMLNP